LKNKDGRKKASIKVKLRLNSESWHYRGTDWAEEREMKEVKINNHEKD